MPLAGGFMEQTRAWYDGVAFCLSEKDRWEARAIREAKGHV